MPRLASAFGSLRNGLGEKSIVAQVGVRIERHWRKENHNWLMQRIRGLDRDVERGIIERPLRPLHPVHHAATSGIGRAGAADGYARIGVKMT